MNALLCLARTCKSIRGFLMQKPAASIWIRLRKRDFDGWPECPADMSELAWAGLVLDDYCDVLLSFLSEDNELTYICSFVEEGINDQEHPHVSSGNFDIDHAKLVSTKPTCRFQTLLC